MRKAPAVITVVALAGAAFATPALAAGTRHVHLTVTSSNPNLADVGGQGLFFAVMRRSGTDAGRVMGIETTRGAGRERTVTEDTFYAFRNPASMGADITGGAPYAQVVTRVMGRPSDLHSSRARAVVLGGTGPYFGATGTATVARVMGNHTPSFRHDLDLQLPASPDRAPDFTFNVVYGQPEVILRGGPGGMGDRRLIGGGLFDAAWSPAGSLQTNSTLMGTDPVDGTLWFAGTHVDTLPNGDRINALGMFQRLPATAPGVASPTNRVVWGGTGQYRNARGQVVVATQPEGYSTQLLSLR